MRWFSSIKERCCNTSVLLRFRGVVSMDKKRVVITGTGLGLSIVRDLVREHGGALAFESQLGLGTRCILTFPLVRDPDRTVPVDVAAA